MLKPDEKLKRIIDAVEASKAAAAPVQGTSAKGAVAAYETNRNMGEPIAVIGLAGQLPKSDSVRAFWRLLDEDVSLIEEIPASRFDWKKTIDPTGTDPEARG